VAGITKIKVSSSASVDYRYDNVKTINVETIKFDDQYIALNTTLPSSNIIWGTSSPEDLTDVTSGDDVIDSAGGDDTINGKNGNDTLAIFSDKANFEIVTLAGLTKIYGDTYVSGLGSAYWLGTIRLNNVENIAFADQTMSVETVGIGGNYIFWGANYGETINGTDADDVIDSGGGSDTIDGGTGDDTLLLFADKADFDITVSGDTVTLLGNSSESLAYVYWLYTITMTNVETIMFADQIVPVSELTNSASANAFDNSTDDDADSPTTPSDDNDTPVTPTNDDPLPELPDLSLFVNDFALGSITLPETVVSMEDSIQPDLSDLIGLLDDHGESLALDFDLVDTDAPVVASVESVKPVIVDWTSHPNPFINSDWNPIIEELYYTAEFT
jgi:hypothetical protein